MKRLEGNQVENSLKPFCIFQKFVNYGTLPTFIKLCSCSTQFLSLGFHKVGFPEGVDLRDLPIIDMILLNF